MTHPPFGLSPQVFSILMVAGWLTIGPIVGTLVMRNRRNRIISAAAASSQQSAAPSPPVYPYLATPEQPYADLIGLWQFKSAAAWIGVVIGVVFGVGVFQLPLQVGAPLGVVCLLVIVLSLSRPRRAAQRCTVDRDLFVTLSRGGREIPLDLNHYRFVRMHVSQARYSSNFPSMMVFDRDKFPGMGTLMGSMLFPRFDYGRIVLFHNRWWSAQGSIISPSTTSFSISADAPGTSRISGGRG